jgi:hypothetical protein
MTNEHTEFKDWLAEVITDSLDMDWSSTDAARLIVERLDEQPVYDAAPDLLEALKGVMDILGRAESNASGNPEWDFVGPRAAKARAAIAKAEGRS